MAEIQTPASAGHDLAATGRVAGPTGPPSDARATIELADVARGFRFRGEVITVRGIDLATGEVEFFSMLGPSDCGKTTTIRMIAGFEEPTRGVVWLDGRGVTGVPANKHDVNRGGELQ
jgi:spermidine/putrescine transport system ATP-binding protein